MGDAGERGPPGPDGNEVRTRARFLFSMPNTYFSLPQTLASSVCAVSLEAGQLDSVS